MGMKINESLPIEQRLGQIGVNTKGEEMIISKYNKEKDIEVIFLHNWQKVKTSYSHFLEGSVKNSLYYKEKYEGQIRISNQGQWMRLLIWNNTKNCVVEFEDGTLVDCEYDKFNSGGVANPNYTKPSENEFYYNDKLECWVGVTKKGDKFLFSHPDEKVIEKVKSCTWCTNANGYVFNKNNNITLHKMIKSEINNDIYNKINHINNNKLDNRYENLRLINAKENARNKKASGVSGITGLQYREVKKRWYGQCKGVSTKYYKDKQEALIDLLIIQRMFKATHNEHLWYLLNKVSQERIDYVEDYTKKKIEKQKNVKHTITCRNTFKKVNDDTYRMYDSKDRSCLIDAEDIERIKKGLGS